MGGCLVHKFTWGSDGLYWQYLDRLTKKAIVQAHNDLYGDKRYPCLKYIIIDLTGVTDVDLDGKAVSLATTFAIRINPDNPRVKVAFVAQDEELRRLIGLYIAATQEQVPHARQELFDDKRTAQEWALS